MGLTMDVIEMVHGHSGIFTSNMRCSHGRQRWSTEANDGEGRVIKTVPKV